MIHWDPALYQARVRERGRQLERVSKGVKFKLSDNYRPDPNTKDPWEERRVSSSSRGSVRQKEPRPYFIQQGNQPELVEVDADFGARVRAARKGQGLSRARFAARIGCSEDSISQIEQSATAWKIDANRYDRIVETLGLEEAEG